ncbi:MAG: carboxylating nicotinate-nucleotide diphosphorylase [Phycisphaerae bacterium]|nr:carboxylating nicotinate-nucleotide diphosphorylase [Phycisphaerae bacterium]
MKIEYPDAAVFQELLDAALTEDGVDQDITSRISMGAVSSAAAIRPARFQLCARQPGTFAGCAVLDAIEERFGGAMRMTVRAEDGETFRAGDTLAMLDGDARPILSIERTMLNFLQRLCGVATLTRRYVDETRGTRCRIYDTRKTIPGWRALDKYAVRCGGGFNHRMGLHDAVLLKDNHLANIVPADWPTAIAAMLDRIPTLARKPDFVEVEVDTLEQLEATLTLCDRIDVVLLDNFAHEALRRAVALRDAAARRVDLEVSGGVALAEVASIAATGVDRIAVGAITHSATAIDLGLDRPKNEESE